MIKLSKINGREILLNAAQIEYIDSIPESKIVMMNGQYHLVTESMDTIIGLVAAYKLRCSSADAAIIRENLTPDKNAQNLSGRI